MEGSYIRVASYGIVLRKLHITGKNFLMFIHCSMIEDKELIPLFLLWDKKWYRKLNEYSKISKEGKNCFWLNGTKLKI